VPAIKTMATTTSISPKPLSPARWALWEFGMNGRNRLACGFCIHPYCGDVGPISIRQYGFCPAKVLQIYGFCPAKVLQIYGFCPLRLK
jgi:hypothetical protein